jgi:hypothetical protein
MSMHDLVDLATSEPPPSRHSVDDIVARGRRVERRRRAGFAASSLAAVAVFAVTAAVALPTALSSHRTPATPGAPATPFTVPAAPFTFTFDGYRVGKLRVASPIDVSTAYQLASIYDDDVPTYDAPVNDRRIPSALYAYLTVYQPGAYDVSKLSDPRHVTIAGRTGLLTSGTDTGMNVRTLAYEYAPDAYAVFTSRSTNPDKPSATQLEQLAAGLHPAAPTTVTVPFTMSYVPAGYVLDEVGSHAMAALNGIASAREGDYAGVVFSNPALATSGLTDPYGGIDGDDPPGSFQVFVVPAGNSNQHPSPGISCGHGFCNRWADGGTVNLQVSSGGRLSDAEMTRILNGITLGDVHHDSTWTPITAALP